MVDLESETKSDFKSYSFFFLLLIPSVYKTQLLEVIYQMKRLV